MQRYLYRLILCATITQCTLCLGFAKMTTTVGSLRTPLRTNQFSLNRLSNPLMYTVVGSRRVIRSDEKCCHPQPLPTRARCSPACARPPPHPSCCSFSPQAGRLAITAAASHLICAYGARDVAPGDLRSKLLALRQALEHELEAIQE